VWCPEQGNLLVVGPARSRKSSGVIAPNLRRWPGGLVVTSTRPEAYHWARAARADNGRPFCVFDPAGLLSAPEAVTWFPWTGAERWDRAVSVAQALSGGLSDEGTTNSRHFAELAGEWLGPVLHAAALAGADLARVRSWVAGIDTAHVVGLLREHGSSVAAADLATLHALADDEGKSAILANARRAVRWAARDDVRRELDPERHGLLDVEGLIAGGGTLVVVSPPARMTELAPLMSALLTTLVERGQELAFCSSEHRLEIPFAFVLDEVPSIAPFPELPAHMATGGGFGMPTLAVAQDLAQLAERWGPERAQTMWDNASCRLVMPGALDERTEEAARRGGGEVLEVRHSGGATLGHASRSGLGSRSADSRQESWRQEWGPAIRQGEVARLILGAALGLPSGLRPLLLILADGGGDVLQLDLELSVERANGTSR
jgi:type IV secretion system protein VirD4